VSCKPEARTGEAPGRAKMIDDSSARRARIGWRKQASGCVALGGGIAAGEARLRLFGEGDIILISGSYPPRHAAEIHQ
jgi:hypothetical protein